MVCFFITIYQYVLLSNKINKRNADYRYLIGYTHLLVLIYTCALVVFVNISQTFFNNVYSGIQ